MGSSTIRVTNYARHNKLVSIYYNILILRNYLYLLQTTRECWLMIGLRGGIIKTHRHHIQQSFLSVWESGPRQRHRVNELKVSTSIFESMKAFNSLELYFA